MRKRPLLRDPVLYLRLPAIAGGVAAAILVQQWTLNAVVHCALVAAGMFMLSVGVYATWIATPLFFTKFVSNLWCGAAEFNQKTFDLKNQPISYIGVQLFCVGVSAFIPVWFIGISLVFLWGAIRWS